MPRSSGRPIPVLIVDDDHAIRGALRRTLDRHGYLCREAADAEEGRELIWQDDPHLLLCDVRMPGESGVELARWVIRERSDVAVVMVTVIDDLAVAEELVELGVYGYLLKPFTPEQVLMQAALALRRREIELENQLYARTLESIVLERTSLLAEELVRHQVSDVIAGPPVDEDALHRLAQAVEFRDREAARHSRRVSAYSRMLAERLGLDIVEQEQIRLAAILHDVGKVAVPDDILLKPGSLKYGEYEVVKRHSEVGYQLLESWPGRLFSVASVIARTHHERWDGTGYPHRLGGDEIPIQGRLTAVTDSFDALTSDRPHRSAMATEDALETMQGESGHFDPGHLEAFLDSRDGIAAVMEGFR